MLAEVKWQKDSLGNTFPREYEPVSAGIKPVSRINPLAVQAMNEIGIDIPYSHSISFLRFLTPCYDVLSKLN
jgi:protein-tyrosine-phosphatase